MILCGTSFEMYREDLPDHVIFSVQVGFEVWARIHYQDRAWTTLVLTVKFTGLMTIAPGIVGKKKSKRNRIKHVSLNTQTKSTAVIFWWQWKVFDIDI